MTILITGSTGFIGKALTKRLGVACRALNLRKEACEWAVGLSGIDTVIHLAARVHVFKDESDFGLSLQYITNVEKTLIWVG